MFVGSRQQGRYARDDQFVVNANRAGGQTDPTITALSSGGFVLAWNDSNDPDGGLRGQIFDASGRKAGSDFAINATVAGPQEFADVSALASGGFVVSWTERNEARGDPDLLGIRAQAFNANGAKIGVEMVVNTVTNGAQRESSVTGLEGGDYVIVWADSSGRGIRRGAASRRSFSRPTVRVEAASSS